MKCQSCTNSVSIGSKFCPACGADIALQVTVKAQKDVSINWLKEIFLSEGYKIKDSSTKGEEEKEFLAEHDEFPNINVSLRDAAHLIVMSIWWKIRKPSMLEKIEFDKIVKEQSTALVCAQLQSFSGSIRIQSSMYICENISNVDVLSFARLVRECSASITPAFKKFY